MKKLLPLVAVLALPASALAAAPVTGNLRAEQLGVANGVAPLNGTAVVPPANLPIGLTPGVVGTTGSSGATTSISTGSSLARTLSDRGGDQVNVRDYGAVGNTLKVTGTAVMASGSGGLSLTGAAFLAGDVGKKIAVPNAGTTPSIGHVTAVAITSPGAGYTSLPVVTWGGSPTTAATPGLLLGAVSATLLSGGTCTGLASSVTGTLVTTTPPLTPATFTLASSGGTSITGLTAVLAPGQWLNTIPSSLTGLNVVVAGCSVPPTVSISLGVISVGFGQAYYGTGYGAGYPLTGNSMILTGGGFSSAAVPGAVTVTPNIPPLETTISAFTDATHVTLAANASTSVNQSEVVTYGTDDTTAIQAALNSGKPSIYIPQSSGSYWSFQVFVPGNVRVYGTGAVAIDPLTTNPLFTLSTSGGAFTSSNVEISGLTLLGNSDSSQNSNSGSALITAGNGESNLSFHNLTINNALTSGIYVDGINHLKVFNNTINGAFYGSGIQLSSTANPSNDVFVSGNTISNTQDAGVSAFFGTSQTRIVNNYVFGSNLGYGDSTSGHVEDCITGYSVNTTNTENIISGNTVVSCGNNGIHWGADHLTISNNQIYFPTLYAILAARAPSVDPTLENDITVSGNHIYGTDRVHSNQGGISVRNAIGCVINGNLIDTIFVGIEIYATADSSGGRDCAISGNTVTNTVDAIWLRKKAQFNNVSANLVSASTLGVIMDNNSLSFDTSGGFASFYNFIGSNTFDTVTTPIDEVAGNFETIAPQHVVTGAWTNPPLVGAATRFSPPIGLGDVATALTALGTNQATAFALAFSTNVFGTVASGTGAVLNGRMAGQQNVIDEGVSDLLVYPPVGGTINGGTTNAPTTVTATTSAHFVCASPTACFTD